MAKKKGLYPWLKSVFGKKEKGPIEALYAGPEYFDKRRTSDGKVYAGPEFYINEDPATVEVYAGPEYFEKPSPITEVTHEEEAPLAPEEEKTPPEPPIFMCVYAGPDYFAGRDPSGAKLEIKTRECPFCGKSYPEAAPVCPYCNARTAFEDGTIACANCGAHVKPECKFCPECGAKQI